MVAPPGIVSKSTTVSIAMSILRKVPGVNFGPDVITWPALVSAFAACNEMFPLGDEWITQCALTLESSEFGNLVNPQDRDMIDLLVNLWDSKTGVFKKITKTSGNDAVENPWVNLIACTTPAWIAGNFPEYVIGGGFTSRCLFIYAEEKEKLVPYPSEVIPKNFAAVQGLLAEDLQHIATALCGPYQLSPEAKAFGETWYAKHYSESHAALDDERFAGYLARKQTHIHKVAMVLAAANHDELVITQSDLETAAEMVTDLEADMPKVFARIGRTETSVQAERFIRFIQKRGEATFTSAYHFIHSAFPDLRDFEAVVRGAKAAGFIDVVTTAEGIVFRAVAAK